MAEGDRAQGPWLMRESDFARLFDALRADDRQVIGPTLRDGAVVHQPLSAVTDLPSGIGASQKAGSYRLVERCDSAHFGYAAGPHSWKPFLFPPRIRLWQARRSESEGFVVHEDSPSEPRSVFLGVRPCDLEAIAIQDRVFLHDRFIDPVYRARRRAAVLVVVHCGAPAATCFCTSTGGGPRAREGSGYDLALTEILDEAAPRYLLEAGSNLGRKLVQELQLAPANEADQQASRDITDAAARAMGAPSFSVELGKSLLAQPDHPRWDEVAERCLACSSCTLSCPTCFCSDVADTTDLSGERAERWRHWDSCFSFDHSQLHRSAVRASRRSRYRQWLTHKLATWFEQFGTSGCVGCGRCIVWCPAAIDLRQEVAALTLPSGDGRHANDR